MKPALILFIAGLLLAALLLSRPALAQELTLADTSSVGIREALSMIAAAQPKDVHAARWYLLAAARSGDASLRGLLKAIVARYGRESVEEAADYSPSYFEFLALNALDELGEDRSYFTAMMRGWRGQAQQAAYAMMILARDPTADLFHEMEQIKLENDQDDQYDAISEVYDAFPEAYGAISVACFDARLVLLYKNRYEMATSPADRAGIALELLATTWILPEPFYRIEADNSTHLSPAGVRAWRWLHALSEDHPMVVASALAAFDEVTGPELFADYAARALTEEARTMLEAILSDN